MPLLIDQLDSIQLNAIYSSNLALFVAHNLILVSRLICRIKYKYFAAIVDQLLKFLL